MNGSFFRPLALSLITLLAACSSDPSGSATDDAGETNVDLEGAASADLAGLDLSNAANDLAEIGRAHV